MNKIILNKNGRNHIKVMLMKDCGFEMPEDAAEKIEFCSTIFSNLQHDEKAIKHFYYRNVKKGYQISVWESENKIYLVNCIRDLDYNYITTLYVGTNLNDMKSIAKMLRENIETIMDDYREQIIEGKEEWDKTAKV